MLSELHDDTTSRFAGLPIDVLKCVIAPKCGVVVGSVLNGSSEILTEIVSAGPDVGTFQAPLGFAIYDANTFLYLEGNATERCITVFNPNNYTAISKIKCEGLRFPSSITVDNQRNIIVTDGGRSGNGVFVLSMTGKVILEFGAPGYGDGQLSQPSDVAVDANDNIIVCDKGNYRLVVFNSKGQFIRNIGSRGRGKCQFNNACSISVFADQIAVADKSNNRVQIITINGQFVRQFGFERATKEGMNLDDEGQLSEPSSVAFDGEGNVFVCDKYKGHLFTNEGKFIRAVGSKGSGYGQLGNVIDTVIDADGHCWALDSLNKNMQQFD